MRIERRAGPTTGGWATFERRRFFDTIQRIGFSELESGVLRDRLKVCLTAKYFSIRTYDHPALRRAAAFRLLLGAPDTSGAFRRSTRPKEEVLVRRFINRTAAWAVSVALTGVVGVMPCAASDHKPAPTSPPHKTARLTQLSPTSRSLLAHATPSPQQQPTAAAAPSTPSSFFKSKRGAVTLALMGAGTVFAIWSTAHDRKPVKSPVR
jgi:hypothetical protein